jgi:predicted TPR repeat methyltransferase
VSDPADPIARARSIASTDEAAAVYRDWAAQYDDDVFTTLGFTGSARIAELLVAELVSRDDPVLDLGCGTGAVGARLHELGVTTIDGVDLSPEMLDVARAKGVYRELWTADLTAPVVIDQPYTASISAGTFTSGHVGASAVPALLHLVEPGGLVAWVIGLAAWPSFGAALRERGVELLHCSVEAIRRDGPPEGVMVVGRR